MRPGEIRILKSLMNGPLRNSELAKKAEIKNPTVRSEYLKNLWKRGLISRDIETRRYKLVSIGYKMLYLQDMMKFESDKIEYVMKDELGEIGKRGYEKVGIKIYSPFTVFFDSRLNQFMDEVSEEELDEAFSKVVELENRLIGKWIFQDFKDEEIKSLKKFWHDMNEIHKMISEFISNTDLPRAHSRWENEDYDSSERAQKEHFMKMYEFHEREVDFGIVDSLDKIKIQCAVYGIELSNEDIKLIMSKIDNIEPEGKRAYWKYMRRIMNAPKILFKSSSGFVGYHTKLAKLVADIEGDNRKYGGMLVTLLEATTFYDEGITIAPRKVDKYRLSNYFPRLEDINEYLKER